jgi:hypothetical protein
MVLSKLKKGGNAVEKSTELYRKMTTHGEINVDRYGNPLKIVKQNASTFTVEQSKPPIELKSFADVIPREINWFWYPFFL